MSPRAVEGRHAMYVGWIAGHALQAGLDVVPIVDDEGRYTDHIGVVLPGAPRLGGLEVRVQLVVGEPPDDWHVP